ncbi:MAG: TetR/AcrR family transcriptional regulator [Clostridia bacterium]|nr:TetR/AcrR family transcriptional regulator [Clostridia bacterium]
MQEARNDARRSKKEYVKSGFVEAAKSIIFRDGVQHVTVRRIAEETGYSYATIYHYFRDLEDLLLEAKLSMIRDMVASNADLADLPEDPLETKKQQARSMAGFFIDNPNIFRFFYQYEMDDAGAAAMRSLELEATYYASFKPFIESGMIREEDVPAISRTITHVIFGSITICLSNNGLLKEEVFTDIDHALDLLLTGRAGNVR